MLWSAMASSSYAASRAKIAGAWRNSATGLKAISFALIGVVNTAVDYSVFLLARAALKRIPAAVALFTALSDRCGCTNPQILLLIAANTTSWLIAATGSYILNSSITFAAESGRELSRRVYVTFVVCGIVGLIVNTTTLVFAARVLLLPILIAKAIAILAGFIVNFSLSHFVVFRVRDGSCLSRVPLP
jgi:putative flippase GtrA